MAYPSQYGYGAQQMQTIRTRTGKVLQLSPVPMQGFIYSQAYRCYIRRIQ